MFINNFTHVSKRSRARPFPSKKLVERVQSATKCGDYLWPFTAESDALATFPAMPRLPAAPFSPRLRRREEDHASLLVSCHARFAVQLTFALRAVKVAFRFCDGPCR